MNSPAQIRHELTSLLMKSLSGDATAAEIQELNRLVGSDASLVPYVVDILGQEATLSWTMAKHRNGAVRRDLTANIAESMGPELPPLGASPKGTRPGEASPRRTTKAFSWLPAGGMALAASLMLIVGCLLGSAATWYFAQSRLVDGIAAGSADRKNDWFLEPTGYVARVVNATSCRWSSDIKFPVRENGALRQGESLQLVEGIADIRLEWAQGSANLRIEGPAGLVLTADYGCSLSHGKLTADVITNDSTTTLSIDTPNGLVELPSESSAGISVSGPDVSVHAFRGSDLIFKPWSVATESPMSISLDEGESITLIERPDGKIDIEHGKSRASSFASQVSMHSDTLNVSPEYVADVCSHDPLLYWRFEDDLDDQKIVRNEMGDRFAGTVYGSVQQRDRNGNRFVEFGASSLIDSTLPRIEGNDDFGREVGNEYTLEVWIKPNHYHLGTIVSFVDQQPIRGDTGLIESPHGLLMEIGGPRTTQTTIEQPGKVRFLHRSPPSGRLKGATCFSELPYEPRHWQHVALVKQGSSMKIYLNGELTGTGEDATSLSPGLRLLIGQLDQWRGARMYVGQLDELAFYRKALSAEEISRHVELVRSVKQSPPGDAPAEIQKTDSI